MVLILSGNRSFFLADGDQLFFGRLREREYQSIIKIDFHRLAFQQFLATINQR